MRLMILVIISGQYKYVFIKIWTRHPKKDWLFWDLFREMPNFSGSALELFSIVALYA